MRTLSNTLLTRPTITQDKVSTMTGLNNFKELAAAVPVLCYVFLGERKGIRCAAKGHGLEPQLRYLLKSIANVAYRILKKPGLKHPR